MTEKKKILIFSLSYFPRFVGGAEVAIRELTDRLSEEFEFHMVTLRYDSTLPRISKEGAVLVHRIGFSRNNPSVADLRKPYFRLLKVWYQVGAFFAARALHRQYAYDGIWAVMAHSAGTPAGLCKRAFPNTPYLLTLQEGDPLAQIEKQMRIFGPLFTRAFTLADSVQAISTFLAAWAKRKGARNVEVIPNGVDLVRFGSLISPQRKEELRTRMGAHEKDILLITTSRLVPKNGVDIVIRALVDLPESVRFAVLGDGAERTRLERLAQTCGVGARTLFLGEVAQRDLPEYLSAANIFVRASRSEGMGNAFIEAMASGLPTIGTNVGGIPDFLHDNETGYLIAPESPHAVSSAVLRIIEQPIEANRIAEGGKRLVFERYGWERVSADMRQLFRSLTL